jgi:hypothetical protein
MILDVHVAYLFAALAVLFGLTYTINQGLNYMIAKAKQKNEVMTGANDANCLVLKTHQI